MKNGKPIPEEKRKNLTADETCFELGVSRATLSRLCREQKIRFYKIGARIFFAPEFVQEFLKSCEVGPQETAPLSQAKKMKVA